MYPIFKKEMKAYFTSMTGYIFLGFFVLLTAVFFFIINIYNGSTSYMAVLSNTIMMFLILIPTITMRLFADERRQKTDQLLFTSPITITQIVLGKFLAALCLFVIGMGITMLFPFIISRYGNLPVAETIGVVVGYLLMVAAFISIGVFVSALTESQTVAAVGTFAALFLFYIMDGIASSMPTSRISSVIFLAGIAILIAFIIYDSTKNIFASIIFALLCFGGIGIAYFTNELLFDGVIGKILLWFSLLSRFDNFSAGIFDLGDIIYYLSFSFVFVYMTINVIEKRRWK